MLEYLTLSTILGALLIFGLRVSDMSLDTLRVLFVMRGRKGLAWLLVNEAQPFQMIYIPV